MMRNRFRGERGFDKMLRRFEGLFSSGVKQYSRRTYGKKYGLTHINEIPLVGPHFALDFSAKVDPKKFSDHLYRRLAEGTGNSEAEAAYAEYSKHLSKLSQGLDLGSPCTPPQAAAAITHAIGNMHKTDRVRISDEKTRKFVAESFLDFVEKNGIKIRKDLGGESGHATKTIRKFQRGSVATHGPGIPYLREGANLSFLLPIGSKYYNIREDGSVFPVRWGQIEFGNDQVPSKIRKEFAPEDANLVLEFESGKRSERLVIASDKPGEQARPGIRDEGGKIVEDLHALDPKLPHTLLFASKLQKAEKKEVAALRRQLRSFTGLVSAETSGTDATDWSLFKEVDLISTNEKEAIGLARGLGIKAVPEDAEKPERIPLLLGKILAASPRIKSVQMHFKNGAIRAVKSHFLPEKTDARSLIDLGLLTSVGLAYHHSGLRLQDKELAKPVVNHEDVNYHLRLSRELEKMGAAPLDPHQHVWEIRPKKGENYLVSFMPKCKFPNRGETGIIVGAGDTTAALHNSMLAWEFRKNRNRIIGPKPR